MKIKYIRWIISVLFMFIAFPSCEKENEYPKRYSLQAYYCGTIKAMSNNGEITDESCINDFIKDYSRFFWQTFPQSDDWQLEIELISASKARFIDSDTSFYYDLIRENGITYFQSSSYATTYFDLTDEKYRYHPLYFEAVTLSYLGRGYIYTPCHYIIESRGELHIPFLSYVERRYGSSGSLSSSMAHGNTNNVFNPDYLLKIQQSGAMTDTVVYQNNMLILREE